MGVSYESTRPIRRLRSLGPARPSRRGTSRRYGAPAADATAGGDNRVQYALINLRGRRLHLLNLHLAPPVGRVMRLGGVPLMVGDSTALRRGGVEQLQRRLGPLLEGPDPVVVAGDLNMTELAPEHAHLRVAGLADAHLARGRGLGWSYPTGPSPRSRASTMSCTRAISPRCGSSFPPTQPAPTTSPSSSTLRVA
jgi:endonuclease/exonuclease/phosphatase family metal-dependent hydrolase